MYCARTCKFYVSVYVHVVSLARLTTERKAGLTLVPLPRTSLYCEEEERLQHGLVEAPACAPFVGEGSSEWPERLRLAARPTERDGDGHHRTQRARWHWRGHRARASIEGVERVRRLARRREQTRSRVPRWERRARGLAPVQAQAHSAVSMHPHRNARARQAHGLNIMHLHDR